MLPVRVTIVGRFWDSYIYRGRLYLWDLDGSLDVFDWDRAVSRLSYASDRTAAHYAFCRGDLLYRRGDLEVLFDDADFRRLLKDKFAAMAERPMIIDPATLQQFKLSRQDTPFRSLHDDVVMYDNTLFALTDRGLFSARAHRPDRNKYKVDLKSVKVWDGGGTCIRGGSGGLAIAAADDGVFEMRPSSGAEPGRVSARHAVAVDWAFSSIYASSGLGAGCLLGYGWREDEYGDLARVSIGTFDDDAIFGSGTEVAWAGDDKLYRIAGGELEATRFKQKMLDSETPDEAFEVIEGLTMTIAGPFVSASAAYFGTVIETDGALIVVGSTEEKLTVAENVTRWRVFPRAERYQNHLHVIRGDAIDILSFNDDYFLNQDTKRLGIRHRGTRGFRRNHRDPRPPTLDGAFGRVEWDDVPF